MNNINSIKLTGYIVNEKFNKGIISKEKEKHLKRVYNRYKLYGRTNSRKEVLEYILLKEHRKHESEFNTQVETLIIDIDDNSFYPLPKKQRELLRLKDIEKEYRDRFNK